ncbi:MAG: 50S ribosomal protein P1 [Candidatus Helarchaeales archaeon]
MEYVYSALILNEVGKKIDEDGISSILKAAGASPDTGRVKAVVAALEGVDIAEAIKSAAVPVAAAPAAAPAAEAKEEKKEEKKKEEKKEETTVGLGALFG